MILAPLLAAIVVATAPSPRAASCPSRFCLGGIALGEPATKAIPDMDTSGTQAGRIYAVFDQGDYGQLSIYYQNNRVIAISVSGFEDEAQTRTYVDPYGVHTTDSQERLLRLRGKPTIIAKNVWRYGSPNGPHWDYLIENNVVIQILASSAPSLAPYNP